MEKHHVAFKASREIQRIFGQLLKSDALNLRHSDDTFHMTYGKRLG